MKYSYNWLKELSGTKKTPEQLVELLTMKAFEVEGIGKVGEGLEGVVVGKILDIQKHPNADKLQLTKVDIDGKKLDIVCGAHNIKVGDKVPVATVGTKLPNGLEIKPAEIRGEKSEGMLCAEDELGLGNDHGGILILDEDAKLGNEVSEELKLEDNIFEIKVLPDRAHDALSHVGMAREICALEGRTFKYDSKKLPSKKGKKLTVEIKDKNLCPRYMGAIIENITVQDSPAWAKNMLKKLGLKPINNVVDATNYVMLELGQPLHAFDASQIANRESQIEIIVRRAKDGEEIKILDGSIKKLTKDDLVIADHKKALAIAGVMGGEGSGITAETKTVIMEAANFAAASIRKTKTRLNLQTDAAYRFEKDIDPNLAELAMARVLEIIKMFGGETVELSDVYPKEVAPWKIKLDLDYINNLLGEKIEKKAVSKILESLGLRVAGYGSQITVTVPTFRIDLKTQEDLIEEIGRVYGYEKIAAVAPKADIQVAPANEKRSFERQVKNILVGNGFSEVYSYSFYSAQDAGLAQFGTIKHLELQNPMNPEQALMRVSLIPNMLKNIRENLKNFKDFRIFESGRVYWSNGSVLPRERRMIVGAVVLEKDKKAENFYAIKGYVDNILNRLGIENQYYDDFDATPVETFDSLWHAGRRGEIKIDGPAYAEASAGKHDHPIGFLGEINPIVLVDFDIHKRVAMFEFDLDALQRDVKIEKEYKAIRKFPTSTRDLSMIAAEKIKVSDIQKNIKKAGEKLILDVQLFDVFEKDGKTSFAFHIEFGADRTLESKEVDETMQKIISALESNLKLEVRKG
ncbi:MAG TPA: phenylalanine--tRNA ligase subunit beta [Candidatus Moranbacteria bacterium]|nr:phenylalanine--tRNA ligase subunit beta [Candidatus Moranbacteria bacterium]